MKLTVCFGHVKVIVPCGEGQLTVKDLIEKSTSRYRKASNKESLDEVFVKYLQTEEDAILDHDDVIADVCDDKDKLIAIYEERIIEHPRGHSQISTASSGVRSFPSISSSSGATSERDHAYTTYQMDREQPVAPPPEFSSNTSPVQHTDVVPKNGSGRSNRRDWRREPPWRSGEGSKASSSNVSRNSSSASSTPLSSPEAATRDTLGFNGFDRNYNRKSLSVGHPMLYSWIDAQEKITQSSPYVDTDSTLTRQDANGKLLSPGHDSFSAPSIGDFDDIDDLSSTTSEEIELESRLREDFGLKVQGYKNADGKELGLIVHEIKNDIVTGKNGSLNVADRITEVNGVNLRDKTNAEAEAILKDALSDGTIKLKRTRSHHFLRASLRKDLSPYDKQSNLPKIAESVLLDSREAPRVKKTAEQIHEAPIEDPKNAAPSQKVVRGKRILIELKKGNTGLGFSLTSRDVVTTGKNPVYVKNILPRGAAIQDGRLRVGDQIVEVNCIDVSDKSQSEVVNILKKASGVIQLLVNREVEESADFEENEELVETISNDSGITTLKDEILSMKISLNELGSASLGISVKGKTSTHENCDLGIYVKSIIKGGAAFKDGRLKVEDRLLQINDISLDGISNEKAMNAMRVAMKESIEKGTINVIVSRKAKGEPAPIHMINERADNKIEKSPPPNINLNDVKSHQDLKSIQHEVDGAPWSSSPPKNKSYSKVSEINHTDTSKVEIERQPRSISSDKHERSRSSLSESGKFVSVSSSEIPVTQPSKTVIIQRSPSLEMKTRKLVEVKSAVFPKEKELFYQAQPAHIPSTPKQEEIHTIPPSEESLSPPSYAETLKRRSTSSSDTGSNRSSQRTMTSSIQAPLQYKNEDPLSDTELLRTMSTSSRFSLDSLVISPDSMPFARDAFGRTSMSERKGRAHLDATKSDFYSKLKKSKSLENVHSIKKGSFLLPEKFLGNGHANTDDDTDIVPFHEAVRRSESLDTVLSNSHDAPIEVHEEERFQRNTAFSKSTPWYAQRATSPTAVKLRSRSTAWNDSFRSAVDRTQIFYSKETANGAAKKQRENSGDSTVPITLTSNANYDANQQARKKSGIFKGIGNLLKKGKQRKSETKEETRDSRSKDMKPEIEKLIDFPPRRRPHSLHEETIRVQRIDTNSVREIERAKRDKEEKLAVLQRELRSVQATEIEISKIVSTPQQKKNVRRDGKKTQQSLDVKIEPYRPTDRKIDSNGTDQGSQHKSLLQRGQQRQREKREMQHQTAILFQTGKPISKTENDSTARLDADVGPESNTVQRPDVNSKHENNNAARPIRNQSPEGNTSTRPDTNSRHETRTAQRPETNLGSQDNKATKQERKRSPIVDRRKLPRIDMKQRSQPESRPEITPENDSKIAQEDPTKQRYLQSSQLFYYGHSSLPRKFTINNPKKKSVGETKAPVYSMEEQTEMFRRAHPSQEEFEARSSSRNSAQRRNQQQPSVNSNVGNITISHAAKV